MMYYADYDRIAEMVVFNDEHHEEKTVRVLVPAHKNIVDCIDDMVHKEFSHYQFTMQKGFSYSSQFNDVLYVTHVKAWGLTCGLDDREIKDNDSILSIIKTGLKPANYPLPQN